MRFKCCEFSKAIIVSTVDEITWLIVCGQGFNLIQVFFVERKALLQHLCTSFSSRGVDFVGLYFSKVLKDLRLPSEKVFGGLRCQICRRKRLIS